MAKRSLHGDAVVGQRFRLYDIWRGLRQRCSNPKATNYSLYGGRGISVCIEWEDYPTFRAWAMSHGYAAHLSIERDNVDGNYEPSNCLWADNTVQACNKRKRLNQTSQYIGVAPNKKNWQAYLDYKGKRHNLGTYLTEVHAAQARDAFVTLNNYPHKLNF